MNTPEQDLMLGFVKAYWAAQPPAVRAFQHMPNSNPDGTVSSLRGELAVALTQQGYDVDLPIMVWDWNPYWIMQIRENEGVTNPMYLNGKPIHVSSSQANYPPFDPPAAPEPAPDTRVVGRYTGFLNWYFSTEAGKDVPNGRSVSQDGAAFVKEITQTLTGPAHKFLKQ